MLTQDGILVIVWLVFLVCMVGLVAVSVRRK